LLCPIRFSTFFAATFYCPLDPCKYSYGSVISLKELKKHAEDEWWDYNEKSFYTAPVFEGSERKQVFCGFKDVFDPQIHMAFDHILEDDSIYETVSRSGWDPEIDVSVREHIRSEGGFHKFNREEVDMMRANFGTARYTVAAAAAIRSSKKSLSSPFLTFEEPALRLYLNSTQI
jgi:hypothetical protein